MSSIYQKTSKHQRGIGSASVARRPFGFLAIIGASKQSLPLRCLHRVRFSVQELGQELAFSSQDLELQLLWPLGKTKKIKSKGTKARSKGAQEAFFSDKIKKKGCNSQKTPCAKKPNHVPNKTFFEVSCLHLGDPQHAGLGSSLDILHRHSSSRHKRFLAHLLQMTLLGRSIAPLFG